MKIMSDILTLYSSIHLPYNVSRITHTIRDRCLPGQLWASKLWNL